MKTYKIHFYQNSQQNKGVKVIVQDFASIRDARDKAVEIIEQEVSAIAEKGDEVTVNWSMSSMLGDDLGLHTTIHGVIDNWDACKYERHNFDVIIVKN